jgi:hypothetical protein
VMSILRSSRTDLSVHPERKRQEPAVRRAVYRCIGSDDA